jgi:2-hydroxy-3-keto-5-methylthiopentenyl-1-phosphate phosphatase
LAREELSCPGIDMKRKKILIQCDFDGTVTEKDVSNLLLDAYAEDGWKKLLKDYQDGKITVEMFNIQAFAMVSASKERLIEAVRAGASFRPGFQQFVRYCIQRRIKMAIVSNGLDFYICSMLRDASLEGISIYSAQAYFRHDGIKVIYLGPDRKPLRSGFKEKFAMSFVEQGYWLTYLGNGKSDISPCKHAHMVFATGDLIGLLRREKVAFIPFRDFNHILKVLEKGIK